ncbi:MAG: hypothetical protein ACM3KM_01625 [Acidobacteriaceae bacterium]
MRNTFSFAVAILVLVSFGFAGQVRAQTARPAPPAYTAVAAASDVEEPQAPPKVVNRFGYTRFGRAPVITNAELRKLFPGKVALEGEDVLAMLDGSKGSEFRRRMEESISLAVFGRKNPDPDFIEGVRQVLANGGFETKEYKGINCKLTNGRFSGDCDAQLSLPLSYANTVTDFAPTPVGFDIIGILTDPIVPKSGQFANQGVRTMFIVAFRTIEEDRATKGLVEKRSQPCLNVSGELVPPPQPPPPPPPPMKPVPPPPPPPRAPLVGVPMGIPAPPPPPPTVDVLLTKVYVKGSPVDPPKNFQDAKFEGTLPGGKTYAAELIGRNPLKWTDENGRSNEGTSVRYVFRKVPVDPNSMVTLDVREVAVPDGWTDQSKHLQFVITKQMLDQMAKDGQIDAVGVEYVNVRKPCRFLKLPCWAWPIIGAGVTTPFLIPRHNEPPVTPVPVKSGGPGPSPVTYY